MVTPLLPEDLLTVLGSFPVSFHSCIGPAGGLLCTWEGSITAPSRLSGPTLGTRAWDSVMGQKDHRNLIFILRNRISKKKSSLFFGP